MASLTVVCPGYTGYKNTFRYMEAIGLAEVVAKLEELQQEHGERFTPAPMLLKLAKAKKGGAFYSE